LHTSAGELKIQKCKFSVFDWKFYSFGRTVLKNNTPDDLKVVSSDYKQTMSIPFLPTNQSYKYVGIQIALDGNMNDQLEVLYNKSVNFELMFTQSYFNANDAAQGFMTIYGPIMKFALPSTTLSKKQMAKIQQPVIYSVLSRLGFNPHMPRAVVHSSTQYGGVGLLELYTEQGCSQALTLLSHLRYQHYLYNPLITLIESYMIASGITT
jgi:hypothetical protein